MSELTNKYRVVAVDLPGHAQTQCIGQADFSLPGMARAVEQFIDDYSLATSTQSITAIGHSAGAAIAAQIMLDSPGLFTRLVSINGALIPLGGLPGLVFPPIAKLSASVSVFANLFSHRMSDPAAVNKLLANTGSTISEASSIEYHALCKDKSHVNGALQMMANWRLENLFPRLGGILAPVQLIAAAADTMIPARDAHRLNAVFKHSDLTIVPCLGHLAHEEQPETIAAIILKGEI